MIEARDIARRIDAFYEGQQDKTRFHMGASGLGEECDRKMWLGFRWVMRENFPGRVLRLFERGQNEEAQIVKWLRGIGVSMHSTEEDQVFIDLGCHVGGSIDGIGNYEGQEFIVEMKTHSKKSFEDLKKKGVKASKYMHYVQMQTYMHGTGTGLALYFSVCKDNDEIYTEWVEFDPECAEKYIERGQRIATQDELPPPISDDPTWWKCRFCNFHGFCHGDDIVEKKSCRTCAHASSLEDGTWYCEKHHGDIQEKFQLEGCKQFELHDHLIKE